MEANTNGQHPTGCGNPIWVSRGVLLGWCTRLARAPRSLALADLGGGREGVDSSALVFLVSRAVEDRKEEEADKAKEEEARMERIENLILVGAAVSAAEKAAWRRWASGAKKKKRKKKLPKASSSRSSSLRNTAREDYPNHIMEGLSTPAVQRSMEKRAQFMLQALQLLILLESGVSLVAPFADVIEAQFLCYYDRCSARCGRS